MTIHSTHPFAGEPDPVRRFRGRLAGGVTLWTAGTTSPGGGAGLTVSSVMVAAGEPAHVVALLDPDSDLSDVVRTTGRVVVQLLAWDDRALAEAFAGTAPAPGGAFAMAGFTATPFGPRLVTASTYAHVEVVEERPLGWSGLVVGIEEVVVGEEARPVLGHHRGRFERLGSGRVDQ